MERLLALAVETVPRALGLCDRDPGSPSAGCCDRNYWHYRILDVANARFQEMGLLFALAYDTPAPGNPFAGRQRMADWARMVWRFWLRCRNSDGSVTEVYPNERSFCGTSFTAAGFVETVRLLGGAAEWRDELAEARTTFAWLGVNQNPEVGNQMAASWLALEGYARLTGDDAAAGQAARRRRAFLDSQWPDGTLPEYGGLDAGYQTITLSVMASLARLNPADRELAEALRRGGQAIAPRIAADGAMDPAGNSRNTQYLYPHGLAMLGNGLLERVLAGIDARTVLRPTWMDDRYCHALAADYFLAYRELRHADDHAAANCAEAI
ncbi:MAG: hypothetical protein AB1918_00370 [Pseudomonadota bacterium]